MKAVKSIGHLDLTLLVLLVVVQVKPHFADAVLLPVLPTADNEVVF